MPRRPHDGAEPKPDRDTDRADGLPFAVGDLLHQRTIESNRVEFKADFNDLIAEAVVRTACAFANDLLNLNGGYILLGVEEKEGRPVLPPRGLGDRNLDELQKKIRGACSRIEPDYQPLVFIEHVETRPLLILFCAGGDNRPYQAPRKKGEGRAFYVRQGCESVEAQGDTLRQLMALTAKVPFDDRRSLEAGVLDLSPTLVRRFLADVGSHLAEASIEDPAIYRRLRIVAPVNAHEAPRNVGLLFFNEDPERFFPGARIDVVRFPDDAGGDRLEERIFRGPLPEQIRSSLDYLTGMSGTLVQKRHDRPEADRTPAYPMEAVREALINAVYHRGYDGPPEPVKVYLYPDRLCITSYPGPLPGIRAEHFAEGAELPAVPARNRRIGDFLKELRLCETRGTGIPKIRRELRKNGSPPPEFRFDEGRTYFEVTLPLHQEHIVEKMRALMEASRPEDAVGPLRRAFTRQPGFLALTQALVECELELGHIEAARDVLRTFSKRREEDEDQPGPFFVAARMLIDSGHREEARAVLEEMPEVRMWSDAHFIHAVLTREAGDLYGAHELFEFVRSFTERSDVLAEFAETKHQLAEEFTNGAREQLLWEAAELLEEAVSLLMDDEPGTTALKAAELCAQRAQILIELDLPARTIAAAFRQAILFAPEEETPRFQRLYADWQARQKKAPISAA